MNEKIRKDRIDINNLPEGWKQEATQGRSEKIFLTDESGEVKGAFCFGCRNYFQFYFQGKYCLPWLFVLGVETIYQLITSQVIKGV